MPDLGSLINSSISMLLEVIQNLVLIHMNSHVLFKDEFFTFTSVNRVLRVVLGTGGHIVHRTDTQEVLI